VITIEVPGSGVIDVFYRWQELEDGSLINPSLLSGGLYLDNAKYMDIPPADQSHYYGNLPFVGTNNTLLARIDLDDYTGVQNVYAYLEMCRKT